MCAELEQGPEKSRLSADRVETSAATANGLSICVPMVSLAQSQFATRGALAACHLSHGQASRQ